MFRKWLRSKKIIKLHGSNWSQVCLDAQSLGKYQFQQVAWLGLLFLVDSKDKQSTNYLGSWPSCLSTMMFISKCLWEASFILTLTLMFSLRETMDIKKQREFKNTQQDNHAYDQQRSRYSYILSMYTLNIWGRGTMSVEHTPGSHVYIIWDMKGPWGGAVSSIVWTTPPQFYALHSQFTHYFVQV